MSNEIFRKEYLEQQHQLETGQILLLSGLNQRIVTVCCILLLLVLLGLLIFGNYTKKTYLEGVIVPSAGLITVKSTQDGVIEDIYVKDGQNVIKAKGLLKINSELFNNKGESISQRLQYSLEEQLSSLKSQRDYEQLMNKSRIGDLESKIIRLDLELESSRQSLEFAKQITAFKQQAMISYRKLLKKNYISDLKYKDYLSDLIRLKAEEENKRLLIHQLEREYISTQHQINDILLQGDIRSLELKRQLDSLQQQQITTSSSETIVHAPIGGSISSLRVEKGQAINQGEVLLNIIPDGSELQVELYAPSRSIGFLHKGQSVGLRFDAYPHEKFGIQKGSVLSISQSTVSPLELKTQDQTIRSDIETLYQIVVSLNKSTINVYGREEPLKVGMRVSADINVETRKLYEWLLGPIARIQGMNG